jgi:hypothetical protein
VTRGARATQRATPEVTPTRRRVVYVVGAGLWLSGGLWLLFHYVIGRAGAFGGHDPLESWWIRVHGGFAFAAIWTFGLLWGSHIVPGWAVRQHVKSGVALVALVVSLILTGYLLYYLADEQQRSVVAIFHWSIGLACPAAVLVHRVQRRLVQRPR